MKAREGVELRQGDGRELFEELVEADVLVLCQLPQAIVRGLSRRGAVIVIWSATAVTGIGGIGLGKLAGWQAILVGVQTLAVLLMLALLEHASRHAVSEEAGE